MAPYWSEDWGNPSSRQHRLGLTASAAVNLARRQIADALAVTPQQLVFTSGATEANNLALLGHARALGKAHLISVATEHHAVLDPLQQLQREGFSVTLLTPGPDGLISPEQLEAAITPETRLVSVMAANNEIGVLQPLTALAAVCRDHGVTLHSDAAQAFGHIPLEPDAMGVDLMSLSAHKLYGPKGVGALVIRDGIALQPLQWGGGQEAGLRAGTLPTALIVGFAAAVQEWMARKLPLRYSGGFVPDVHQILVKSRGIFCHGASALHPSRLNALYQVLPVAYLVEAAGGATSNGAQSALDVVVEREDQVMQFACGSALEVKRFEALVGPVPQLASLNGDGQEQEASGGTSPSSL